LFSENPAGLVSRFFGSIPNKGFSGHWTPGKNREKWDIDLKIHNLKRGRRTGKSFFVGTIRIPFVLLSNLKAGEDVSVASFRVFSYNAASVNVAWISWVKTVPHFLPKDCR